MSRGRGKRAWGDNGWGEWGGYINAKKQKLAEQFTADTPRNIQIAGTSPDSCIFEGVSIHVNGYTVPSSDELKRLMMLHGGMYHHFYSKTKVTHVIATRLPYAKIKELRDEKIVRPEWIMDSIKAGRLLPDGPYQLYTNRTTAQGTLKFTDLKKDGPHQHQGYSTETLKAKQTTGDSRSVTQGVQGVQGTTSSSLEGHSKELQEKSSTTVASPNGHTLSSDAPRALSPQNTSTVHSLSSAPSKTTAVMRDRPEPVGSKGIARAGDANFVSEFYSNSRLHHISTWGAEFKAFVNKLQSSGDLSFPGREKLRQLVEDRDNSPSSSGDSQEMHADKHTAPYEKEPNQTSDTSNPHRIQYGKANQGASEKPKRVIMHLDMDCFFVSVGLRNRPDLVGKPVAVTHSRGKGMPQGNQEAREYEAAFYAKKFKQNGGKGMKTRHIDLAKASVQDAAKPTEAEDAPEKSVSPSSGSDDPVLSNVSTSAKESPAAPDKAARSPGQLTEPADQRTAQKTRVQSEPFNSMAETASCSYEARRAGVKNGMFMGAARKRCPDLQTIPYDFEGYRKVSQTLYETVASYTHDIEAVSCDEMFVDVTGILEDTGATPLDLAQVLRQEIKEKTQCNASAGLASNILLARMSTRKAKPNGQFFLETRDVMEFMKQQPVKDLPGVGWSTGARLRTMGVETCGDLQNLSLSSLQKEFGPKTGQSLYSYCRGIDDRPIRVERERKSVSAEINYGIRFTQSSEAEKFVSELATEVHQRLTAIQMIGKTITLKLKVRQAGAPKETSKFLGHGVCDNLAKSTTLAQATDKLSVIQQESKALLVQMQIEASDLRGVGIQMSRLSSASTSATSTSSNNASLLDFVKPLPKTSEPPTAPVKDPTRDHAQKEKKPSGTILNFVSKQKAVLSDPKIPAPLPDLPQPKKTPLPPLPTYHPITPTPLSRTSRTQEQQEQFCLPSPSQVDPSVLAALPADIRESIERTYKERKEQNGPQGKPSSSSSISSNTTNGLNQPATSASSTSLAHPLASVAAPSRPRDLDCGRETLQSVNNHHNLYSRQGQTSVTVRPSKSSTDSEMSVWDQPSTSNGVVHIRRDQNQESTSSGTDHSGLGYDPSVLKELPPDIVQEIMEQERARFRNGTEGQSEVVTEEDKDVLGPVEALPSFSQVDPSCLEALPSELRNELRQAYQRQQKTSQDTSPSKAPSAPKSSPFKLHRRRGRPRKGSPRKGAKQGFKIPGGMGILEMVTGVKSSPGGKTASGFNSSEPSISKDDQSGHNGDSVEDTEAVKTPAVNLCGAVALWDVKALLKEWTTSVEEPGDEDIDHLVIYLNELIVDRNLEMMHLVLRAMKRLANQMESTSPWRDAYQTIEDRVQDTISHMYSSKLKIV